MPVLLSGASGMIGNALRASFARESIPTFRLVRSAATQAGEIHWNPEASSPEERFPEIPASVPLDAAIHLSGANIAGHLWTPAYREQLRQSRVASTQALCELLIRLPRPPRVLVCASAIGIYGDRGSDILDETSPPGTGFLADLCREWEAAAQPAESFGIRVLHLRFGVVLAAEGGMLAKLLPVFRLGAGGKLGSGQQWMSWVALPDVVRIIRFALEREDLRGAINVVTPHPVTNLEFTRAMGRVLHRPAFFAVPAAALRLIFGEMANSTMLASTRVLPRRILEAGFRLEHEELEPALRSLLRK
ncbi:MAG TPA: TIGR01777 family oxidoreductase [Acidisarcina sp.]|nr:TIGR01777 family oxidoreductase [Acidisarcina sp.]